MPAKSIFCVPCALSWRKNLLFAVAMLLGASAHAGLQWQQRTIQLDLHPLQVTGSVTFPFKNTGTNAVDINSVRTTCGCLKASANTNQVAPGQSGAVNVAFNFRDKTGPQRKAVAVRASDSKPVVLYVQGSIPEVYILSAKRLEWSLSGDREQKTCRLVNRLATPVHLVSAVSTLDSFAVELIPTREGFEYEVRITPVPDAAPGKSAITIQTECPPELKESRTYTFSAVIR